MDGSQPGGGDGVAPVDVAPESSATVKQMFLDAAARIFDEEDAEPGEKASRIAQLAKTLLQVEDDVDAAVNGEEDEDEQEGTESVRERRSGRQAVELAEAKKRLSAFERREKARDALEAAKVEPTKARTTALAALESEEDRKALIEEFKGIPTVARQPGRTKPKSVPASTLEGQGRPETLSSGLKPRTKEELRNLASSLQRR